MDLESQGEVSAEKRGAVSWQFISEVMQEIICFFQNLSKAVSLVKHWKVKFEGSKAIWSSQKFILEPVECWYML